MQSMLKRSLLFGLTSLGAVIGIGLWTAGSIHPARAQSNERNETRATTFKAGGPIQLQNGERALIGLLLPAVQKVKTPFRLMLSDDQGHTAELKLDPPAKSSEFLTLELLYSSGALQLVDPKTGQPLSIAVPGDGVFAVQLLPAVQKGGNAVGGISASLQLFDANGARTGIVQMCDGSV